METDAHSASDYLYYVIEDSDHRVRGHLIGVAHWVEPKDQALNPCILKAINDSARVVLEIPPDAAAPLLPTEANSRQFKAIIDETVANLPTMPALEMSSRVISLETTIGQILEDIKHKGLMAGDKSQQGYQELEKALATIPSLEEKIKFLIAIKENIFNFNLVSLERNIHKIVMSANKKIKHLEGGDLNDKLLNAKLQVGLRNIKAKIAQGAYMEILEQISNIGPVEERLRFIANKKSELGIEDEAAPINHEEVHALEEALYRAWVDGNVEKLRELRTRSSQLFKPEPEFERVHQSRDKQMAERIIKVGTRPKNRIRRSPL